MAAWALGRNAALWCRVRACQINGIDETDKSYGGIVGRRSCCTIEVMRFRITYDGELKSGNNSSRSKEKWVIRRAIHPQLAELWAVHPVIKRAKRSAIVPKEGGYFWIENLNLEDAPPRPFEPSNSLDLLAPLSVDGCNFARLIRSSVGLACSLDIVFMRKGDVGSLITRDGDIDNRIKTLFDGLRVPKKDELIERPSEDPFYCLLEEDSLITDFAVHSDRLLSRPGASDCEVRLVIEVVVKVTKAGMFNMPFWAG